MSIPHMFSAAAVNAYRKREEEIRAYSATHFASYCDQQDIARTDQINQAITTASHVVASQMLRRKWFWSFIYYCRNASFPPAPCFEEMHFFNALSEAVYPFIAFPPHPITIPHDIDSLTTRLTEYFGYWGHLERPEGARLFLASEEEFLYLAQNWLKKYVLSPTLLPWEAAALLPPLKIEPDGRVSKASLELHNHKLMDIAFSWLISKIGSTDPLILTTLVQVIHDYSDRYNKFVVATIQKTGDQPKNFLEPRFWEAVLNKTLSRLPAPLNPYLCRLTPEVQKIFFDAMQTRRDVLFFSTPSRPLCTIPSPERPAARLRRNTPPSLRQPSAPRSTPVLTKPSRTELPPTAASVRLLEMLMSKKLRA